MNDEVQVWRSLLQDVVVREAVLSDGCDVAGGGDILADRSVWSPVSLLRMFLPPPHYLVFPLKAVKQCHVCLARLSPRSGLCGGKHSVAARGCLVSAFSIHIHPRYTLLTDFCNTCLTTLGH